MKIQLKRSNVLDGGKAKEPTAPQMEFGELAVNYNSADPAIFIKGSSNDIIRIAAGNSLSEIPTEGGGPHQPGTLDDRYVEITGDNMTGNLTLGTNKITLDASSGSATFAGKATSASTASGDSGITLVTKDYLTSGAGSGTGIFGYWNRTGTTLNPVNAGDKVTSASTESNDAGTTLTTKDYVDFAVGSITGNTDISITHTATTATVNSSTGDSGQIDAATTTTAGVMTADDKAKLDGIEEGAVAFIGTDLDNIPAPTIVTVTSSTGYATDLPAATDSLAGVMTADDKAKLDGIEEGAAAFIGTDLDNIPTSTIVTVTSSTGYSTDLPAATTALAGVMTADDKAKLDDIEEGAGQFVGTDLDHIVTSTKVTVISSTGYGTDIPAATDSLAGVMTADDKAKLDSIADGAGSFVGTDLSNTPDPTTVTVNSSTGDSTILPAATTTDAGVMTAADKTKLNSYPASDGTGTFGYWNRTGTTLSTANSEDDVSIGDGYIVLYADGSADFVGGLVYIDSFGDVTSSNLSGAEYSQLAVTANGTLVRSNIANLATLP